MSIKVYCGKCKRSVVLDKIYDFHRGECLCGYTVTARNDSHGKMYFLYHETAPPTLGISVSDGIGAEDKFGG